MSDSLRWSVVIGNLDSTVGHEQAGTRRVLIVSYEAFHRGGMVTICPISGRPPRYPNEVALAAGQAGQTIDGAILCHQARTISRDRLTTFEINGRRQSVTDHRVRAQVRGALARQLGLDIPAEVDGAA